MRIPFHPSLFRRRLLVVALVLPLCTGCFRRISYTSPEGRRVDVLNVGFDTSIATLRAETPQGSVTLEGADSRATVAASLADLARTLAAEGGRP